MLPNELCLSSVPFPGLTCSDCHSNKGWIGKDRRIVQKSSRANDIPLFHHPKKAKLQHIFTFSKNHSLAYFVVHSILIRIRPPVGYISVACSLVGRAKTVTLPKERFAPGALPPWNISDPLP